MVSATLRQSALSMFLLRRVKSARMRTIDPAKKTANMLLDLHGGVEPIGLYSTKFALTCDAASFFFTRNITRTVTRTAPSLNCEITHNTACAVFATYVF